MALYASLKCPPIPLNLPKKVRNVPTLNELNKAFNTNIYNQIGVSNNQSSQNKNINRLEKLSTQFKNEFSKTISPNVLSFIRSMHILNKIIFISLIMSKKDKTIANSHAKLCTKYSFPSTPMLLLSAALIAFIFFGKCIDHYFDYIEKALFDNIQYFNR